MWSTGERFVPRRLAGHRDVGLRPGERLRLLSGRGRIESGWVLMSARFEELDWRPTAMGELVLRRRRTPSSDVDIYEVKLGDEFLMSSMFTVAEVEMARLALGEVPGTDLD